MRLSSKFILIAIGLTLMPLLVVGAIGFTLGRNGVYTHTDAHLKSVTFLQAQAAARWLDVQIRLVETHLYAEDSAVPVDAVMSTDSPSSEQALNELKDQLALLLAPGFPIVDVVVFDSELRPRFSVAGSSTIEFAGARSLMEEPVKVLVEKPDATSSAAPTTAIAIGGPLRGQSTGYVGVLLDPAALAELITPDPGLGGAGLIYYYLPGIGLVSSNGLMPLEAVPLWLEDVLNQAGRMGRFNLDGEVMVGRAAAVEGAAWTVIAAMPASDAFADVERMGELMVASTAVLAVLAAAVAWVLGKSVTRPLRQLVAGVRDIAGGDLGVRLPVRSRDEIGELASAFNAMGNELEATQAKLYQERLMLAGIQGSMNEGLLALNEGGEIIYANAAAKELWEVAADEFHRMSLREVLERTADQFESVEDMQRLLRALEDGSAHEQIEIALRRPTHRDLALNVFEVLQGDGRRVTGLLFRDVTEEKDLAHRKDRFVSIASHELRTPLTAILGFSELIMLQDIPPAEAKEWIGKINDDAKRLAEIVEDMLDISRIQNGTMELRIEPLKLRPVLDRAVSDVQAGYPERDYAIQSPLRLPEGLADENKLLQVLVNLISNASKYSPDDQPVEITVRHEAAHERIVFAVRDHGIGIAEEDHPRLFSAFYRVQRPETRTVRGTGLGLHIVKSLVERMNGEVWFESQLNQGSTFYFSVPSSEATANRGSPLSVTEPRLPESSLETQR